MTAPLGARARAERALLGCWLVAVAACGSKRASGTPLSGPVEVVSDAGNVTVLDPQGKTDGGSALMMPPLQTDPFDRLPTGKDQLAILCARNLGDPISKAFCATPGVAPPVNSLVDLQKLVDLDFKPGNDSNGRGGNPAFALTANSSSLVARFTSAINPRAIIFTPPHRRARIGPDGTRLAQDAGCEAIEPISPLQHLVAMGFARGEEVVELIAKDPTATGGEGNLNFYLFKFEHACAKNAFGCTNADLLTPTGEASFTGDYSLYQDDDVANTIFDCKQCHQPGGPGTRKMLRMQELVNPWSHFLRNNRENGTVLMDDYKAAHADETYAGIPAAAIFNADVRETAGFDTLEEGGGPDAAALQGLVENEGFCDQPNAYDSFAISAEVEIATPLQPAINVPVGQSPTWAMLFERSRKAEAIPPPYHDVKTTDPDRLREMTAAYVAVRTGQAPAARLPDIRDVFLDAALTDLTFRPAPGKAGKEILVQMCGQCHNRRLDQTLSRAKFRVDDLESMSRAEKDIAIHRLSLPRESARRMPPPRFRDLSAGDIDKVIAELRN
jgi:hypothetical protein